MLLLQQITPYISMAWHKGIFFLADLTAWYRGGWSASPFFQVTWWLGMPGFCILLHCPLELWSSASLQWRGNRRWRKCQCFLKILAHMSSGHMDSLELMTCCMCLDVREAPKRGKHSPGWGAPCQWQLHKAEENIPPPLPPQRCCRRHFHIE